MKNVMQIIGPGTNSDKVQWPYRADLPQRYSSNYRRYLDAGGLVRRDEDVRAFAQGGNVGDMSRFYFLCLVLDQIHKEAVDGNIAELGVYKGYTAAVLANMARRLDRIVYLFDTYEGFSQADLQGIDSNKVMQFGDTSLEAVRSLVGEDNVRYVKGHFPDSLKEISDEVSYCLVHIDCDLYAPIASALNYFYPRMTPGGFLVIHDYSSLHWNGAERAVDEFFADKPECAIPLTDSAGSVVIRRQRVPDRYANWLVQKKCRVLNEAWTRAADGGLSEILGAGWSGPENWGVWGVGDAHEVSVYLPAAVTGDLEIDADVHVPLPKAGIPQYVDVFVAGCKAAVWEFTEALNCGIRTIRIPAAVATATDATPPFVTLTFRPHRVVNPTDIDPTTNDRRPLGLALHGLRRRVLSNA